MIEMEPYCEKQVGDDDYFPARATSGLPVTLSSDNARVAVVKNGRINIRRVGTARITAVQKGDLDFAAALPVEQVLTVTDASSINGTVDRGFCRSGGSWESFVCELFRSAGRWDYARFVCCRRYVHTFV